MDEMITSIDELDLELFMRGQVEEALKISNNKFKFLTYSHAETGDGGVHVFYYGLSDYKNPITDKEWELLKEFFEKDDDSQPHGLCRMYFGSIWHMVPYEK